MFSSDRKAAREAEAFNRDAEAVEMAINSKLLVHFAGPITCGLIARELGIAEDRVRRVAGDLLGEGVETRPPAVH